MQDVTSARCGCVREGVVMKLAEEPRSPRIALRTEARAIIDRIRAGEVIPRLISALGAGQLSDSDFAGSADEFDDEGNRRSTRRPEKAEGDTPPQPEGDRPQRQESERSARGDRRSPFNGLRDTGARSSRRDSERRDAQPVTDRDSSKKVDDVPRQTEVIPEPASIAPPSQPETTASSNPQRSTPNVSANDDVDDFAAGLDDDVDSLK